VTRPSPLPWARPRHELLLLALVAAAGLTVMNPTNVQDLSRICLTRALVAGRLTVDSCIDGAIDRSSYGDHLYSNKAPGMSALEIPSAEAIRLSSPSSWGPLERKLVFVRLLSSGLAFLVCAFTVGRISEGLVTGSGGLAMVGFALATLAMALAAVNFDQLLAGALGFGAFALAWSRRPLLAGLAAGAAVTVEYQAAAILVVVGVYVATMGVRSLLRFAAGALPGIVLLAAYDWAAFGAPWHNAQSYGVGTQSQGGILGVHPPASHAIRGVFLGDRGLLVASPALLAAATGLVLLWRSRRVEAAVCGAVTAIFVVANCGYLEPYGGLSPGPRYLVPALPFLALGFASAIARFRRLTIALIALSIVPMTSITLTWASGVLYRQTIWGEIGRFAVELRSSRLSTHLQETLLSWAGASRPTAALIVALCATAALWVAASTAVRR